MHAIKVRWAGQPFALAKCNESEGRKTRIRRSKEERKAMVESFIKKYQELNKGSFPSLNLTHKEVGGSFYTVREIVRDIIQENRVLGPGKWLLEEQSPDQSLEENPLHSIAIEPQYSLTLSSKEADFPGNYNQGTDEEPVPLSDEQCTSTNTLVSHSEPVINGSLVDMSNNDDSIKTELQENEHQEVEKRVKEEPETPITQETDFLVNYHQDTNEEPIPLPDEHCTSTNILTQVSHSETVINGRLVDVSNNDDSDASIKTGLQENEHQEVEKRVKEEPETPTTQEIPLAADVVVETFPLRPLSGAVNNLDGRSETCISIGVSEKQVSQIIELEGNSPTKTSGPVDENVAKNFASPLLESKSDVVEEAPAEFVEPTVESSNGFILKEGNKHEVQSSGLEVCADTPTSVTIEQSQKSNDIKAADAASGTQNLKETFSRGIDQSSKIKEETEVEDKVDAQKNGGSQKESIPTLNRLNLESWEGASKNSSKPEGNPLLAIIKALVAAFVKFWSE